MSVFVFVSVSVCMSVSVSVYMSTSGMSVGLYGYKQEAQTDPNQVSSHSHAKEEKALLLNKEDYSTGGKGCEVAKKCHFHTYKSSPLQGLKKFELSRTLR
eukprot:TRINITY_DN7108_c0_g2_i8.p3 TRINITY_DN7108_c0_g2~~TRINITY_DN7108_c0_g2_i8.p3  ORF type:complete len:100 (+),score=15.06 TRINITY_DN7108_c0_g2_i8:356-655(+)